MHPEVWTQKSTEHEEGRMEVEEDAFKKKIPLTLSQPSAQITPTTKCALFTSSHILPPSPSHYSLLHTVSQNATCAPTSAPGSRVSPPLSLSLSHTHTLSQGSTCVDTHACADGPSSGANKGTSFGPLIPQKLINQGAHHIEVALSADGH